MDNVSSQTRPSPAGQPGPFAPASAGGHTYGDLKPFGTARFRENGRDDPYIRNATSGLNEWMRFVGASDSTVIGDEMRQQFDARFDALLAELDAKFPAPEGGGRSSTYNTRKSQIRRWKEIYDLFVVSDGLPKEIGPVLKVLMERKGFTYWTLCKRANCMFMQNSVKEWSADNYIPRPQVKNYDRVTAALASMERVLGVPAGTLVSRYPKPYKARPKSTATKPEYNERLREYAAAPYRVNDFETLPGLDREWPHLFKFKCSPAPPFGMKRKYPWREDTADIFHQAMASFFGFCLLPTSAADKRYRGAGLKKEDLGFALLTDHQLVEAWLAFLKERAGDFNGGTKSALVTLQGLLHPVTGWITQMPSLGERLGMATDPESWAERCQVARARYKELEENYDPLLRQTREAMLPIQKILDMQHPMDALFELEERIEADRPQRGSPSFKVGQWMRDLVFVKAITANPLRIANFSMMTYDPEHPATRGHLRKKDGRYWLHFEPQEFKNQRGAARKPYARPLPDDLTPYIDDYLSNYRPLLPGGDDPKCKFVFRPAAQIFYSPEMRSHWSEQYDEGSMSTMLQMLTERYIPHLGVFRPQAVRHIVATDYIRNNPEGFETAAKILHDKPETVRKNYAHLKEADSLDHWYAYRASIRTKYESGHDGCGDDLAGLRALLARLSGPDKDEALRLLAKLIGGRK